MANLGRRGWALGRTLRLRNSYHDLILMCLRLGTSELGALLKRRSRIWKSAKSNWAQNRRRIFKFWRIRIRRKSFKSRFIILKTERERGCIARYCLQRKTLNLRPMPSRKELCGSMANQERRRALLKEASQRRPENRRGTNDSRRCWWFLIEKIFKIKDCWTSNMPSKVRKKNQKRNSNEKLSSSKTSPIRREHQQDQEFRQPWGHRKKNRRKLKRKKSQRRYNLKQAWLQILKLQKSRRT